MPDLSTPGPNGSHGHHPGASKTGKKRVGPLHTSVWTTGAQLGHSVSYSIAPVGVRQTWGPYKHQCHLGMPP
eukprot:1223242-Pyramimonas_sp.AAC.1